MELSPNLDRQTDPALAAGARDPALRRCLATGEELPKDELIRFVVGPDNSIVPDLAQNLPGRGLWVKADADVLALAARKNLFARAAKASVSVAADLAQQVGRLLRKRCFDYLGLAKGAGVAVLGETQVESALRAGKLGLLLLAPDAGNALSTTIPAVRTFSREELGAAFGFGQIVYAGLMPHGLTAKLKSELARLEKIAPDTHIFQ